MDELRFFDRRFTGADLLLTFPHQARRAEWLVGAGCEDTQSFQVQDASRST